MIANTALIGNPAQHSLSPFIHNFWLAKQGIKAGYCALEVTEPEFINTLERLIALGFRGVNLTIPYKQHIFKDAVQAKFNISLSDNVKNIRATNTLIFNQGNITAENTDCYGFLKPLLDSNVNIKGVYIIGAGGACYAILSALLYHSDDHNHFPIYISNRTVSNAKTMVQTISDATNLHRIKIVDHDITAKVVGDANIIINTTNLGMGKYRDLLPISAENIKYLQEFDLVYDIIYAKTPLLLQAEKQGVMTIDGLPMLIFQAQKSFQLWHNCQLKDHLINAVKQHITK
jgi:shikimate dehydrogenase